ncbi:hypothetical protein JCM8547_000796 [Rhodosporidiobolus lusitaniae]
MPKTLTASHPSPVKQPLKHSQPSTLSAPVIYDEHHDDDHRTKLGWADLQALREDFDLEAASHLRLLSTSLTTRLSTLDRHFSDLLASLDHRVRNLSLARFVGEFNADHEKALRGVVEEGMKPVEMGDGEKGARKRKRMNPLSPSKNGEDDTDLSAAGPSTASKKQRSNGVLASASKGKTVNKTVPGSARGVKSATGGASGGAGGAASPTSTRKPSSRLRVRPSTQNPSSLASSTSGPAANFVYHASVSASTLPTPARPRTKATSTVRHPKRGESIVMRSLNDSPLGEFVASDVELEPTPEEKEEEEEGEGSEEWDLLSAHEASRSEGTFNRSPSKGKLHKSRPPPPLSKSSSKSTISAPTKDGFDVSLPAGAPDFGALKEEFVRKMREELLRGLMGDDEGGVGLLGVEERKRVEEVVMRMHDPLDSSSLRSSSLDRRPSPSPSPSRSSSRAPSLSRVQQAQQAQQPRSSFASSRTSDSNPFRDASLDFGPSGSGSSFVSDGSTGGVEQSPFGGSPPTSSLNSPYDSPAVSPRPSTSLSRSPTSSTHSPPPPQLERPGMSTRPSGLMRDLAAAAEEGLPTEVVEEEGGRGTGRGRSGTVTTLKGSRRSTGGAGGGKEEGEKSPTLLQQFRSSSGWFAPLVPPSPPLSRTDREALEKARIEKLKAATEAGGGKRPSLMKRMSSGVEMWGVGGGGYSGRS